MLPKINNKSFLECAEEDFESLIENLDYRENEYIDYKKNFAFLEIPKEKKVERNSKISEFRSDVCSFANAEGGYLIFGISDENGCAKEIIGVDIPNDNTDKFELDRRNNLNGIYPRTPYIKFNFTKLQNGKYIVVIFVKRDNFAPYTHIENESCYVMCKRSGNEKKLISYLEMKNMFNQSLSLEKEICNYRKERIEYYKNQAEADNNSCSCFLLFHIVPETFLDTSYNKNMFVLDKFNGRDFSQIFSEFCCATTAIPCVDGLRYVQYDSRYEPSECYIYNSGIVECYYVLDDTVRHVDENKYPNGFIPWKYIWDKLQNTYEKYKEKFKDIYSDDKIYLCVSIVGCKGVTSEDKMGYFRHMGKIDRDLVMCSPVCINNLNDDNENELILKKLYIEYLLSIGVRKDEELTKLIKEVYDV